MKLGISSWTYPWAIRELGAFGLLERAAALGVGVVQIADNLPMDEIPPADVARLAAAAKQHGLTLELGTRGVEPPRLARFLGLARDLGVTLVRTLLSPDLTRAEAWLREALPGYERAGVTLALENYEQHSTRDLAALVGRIASPRLGICLDTVNSLGALEPPEQVLPRLAPLAVNLHIKDFDIERVPSRMGFLVVGRPAGEGRLDIPALLDEVRRLGRDPNVIVEQWPPDSGDLAATIAREAEWAEQSVRYLRQYIAD